MHHAMRALSLLIFLVPSVRADNGPASYQKTVDTVALVLPNGVRKSLSVSDITPFINASLIKPTGP